MSIRVCSFFRSGLWSPFSPDQTWSDSQLSRLEVLGSLLQVSPSAVVRAARPLATKSAISARFSHLGAVTRHLLSRTSPPTHSFSLMCPSRLASILSSSLPPSHNSSFLALSYSRSFRHRRTPLVAQAIPISERQRSKIIFQLSPTATPMASSFHF